MLALLGLCAVCAGLAASLVNSYARNVRAQVGPLVSVLVAKSDIQRGERLTTQRAPSVLAIRRVPERFVPPSALRSPRDAIGLRAASFIAAGDFVGRADVTVGARRIAARGGVARARLVEIPVAGGEAVRRLLRSGSRVDVIVTSEQAQGSGRAYLALQRIELADLRPLGDDDASSDGERHADSVATLAVTLRQAVLLTAAQNFAREVRLVPRPAGDDRRLDVTAVSAAQLHP
jgi:pilus assembly protein CpaB